ncbi:MAG TPA: hypothetical protein VEB00_14375 [Clostridia bacterium]|nr:hypothetical protein [Clostridia bacterium]
MLNKRKLVFCIMLAVLAAALQAVPRILGTAFAFAAILGGFPVYIAAGLNWALGIAVYLTAAYITSIINISEALFFVCTNGIIGLSLGILKNRFGSIYFAPAPSALIVISMLFAVNYLFEISIFGYSALKTPIVQAFTLFLPLYIYCLIYLKLAMFADTLLYKYIDLDAH